MRGRKPKPTALKLLAGVPGHRALPLNEPKPPLIADPFDVPEHLPENVKAQWRNLAPKLKALGILTEVDLPMFESLCYDEALVAEARLMLGRTGVITRGSRKQPMVSPWERIVDRTEWRLDKLRSHFGMSPAARARLHVESPDARNTENDRFFFGPA